MKYKKLIEVAVPLDAINKGCVQESNPFLKKHVRMFHLWWARRPLASVRGLLLCQLIDDPSCYISNEEEQNEKRKEILGLIGDLCDWKIKEDGQKWAEIRKYLPELDDVKIFDPFSGGATTLSEAARIGVSAVGSDLNPVATLIGKGTAEFPSRFKNVIPTCTAFDDKVDIFKDLRRFAQLLNSKSKSLAEKKGLVFSAKNKKSGETNSFDAKIYARSVLCPNPGCNKVTLLAKSFLLSKKKSKAGKKNIKFVVTSNDGNISVRISDDNSPVQKGNMLRRGAVCIHCNETITLSHLQEEGKKGKLGNMCLGVVDASSKGKAFLDDSDVDLNTPEFFEKTDYPDQEILHWQSCTNVVVYGLSSFGDLFTERQKIMFQSLFEGLDIINKDIKEYVQKLNLSEDATPLNEGGSGKKAYTELIHFYLAIAISQLTRYGTTLCTWNPENENINQGFGRPAMPMTWDYVELNLFGSFLNVEKTIDWVINSFSCFDFTKTAEAFIGDSAELKIDGKKVIFTDPPYYDNVPYSNLSDFFYVWLRLGLKNIFPNFFQTALVPKNKEIVASHSLFNSEEERMNHFSSRIKLALENAANGSVQDFPLVIFYAFRQSELKNETRVMTGWEAFLESVINSKLKITGTWPVRTERTSGLKGEINSLASSVAVICRKIEDGDRPVCTKRELLMKLRREIPVALRQMTSANIAPVDLNQAIIGPGMAIFTDFEQVLESDGSPMSVGSVLNLIVQIMEETMANDHGDYDNYTRWAIEWFKENSFEEGEYGMAENLSTSKNISIEALERCGVCVSGKGKLKLVSIEEMFEISQAENIVWIMLHQLAYALVNNGEIAAAEVYSKLGSNVDACKELAFRLFQICEKNKKSKLSQYYNSLISSWGEIERLA